MATDEAPKEALTPGAARLVEMAAEKQQETKHEQLGVYHWLLALVERHGPMAEEMAQGLIAADLMGALRQRLRAGETGTPLDKDRVIHEAAAHAEKRQKAQIAERDLAAAILAAAGYALVEPPIAVPVTSPPADPGSAGAPTPAQRARQQRLTPTLDRLGLDLTQQAELGKLNAVVGREQEIQLVVETLCRSKKRNPALVGPAGVGKTAIVEGLAQRIVRGNVPAALRGTRIVSIQPSSLIAGAGHLGEFLERVKALFDDASQDGIVLFIDEVHSIVGAGGMPGTNDIASLLKPRLARGDLACIAATTDDEYRRFVETDKALERRFQRIAVEQPTPEQTLAILVSVRDELTQRRHVEVPDETVRWLVRFADRFLPHRNFPDKAVDLLEQSFAHAITEGKTAVDLTDAEAVAQRIVGMPIDLNARLGALTGQLSARSLLTEADTHTLLRRLEVTMRDLDIRSARPNAVVLLLGEAAAQAPSLAEVLAQGLFGRDDRIVAIDLGSFVHPADVTRLVGSSPGYVGYEDRVPLHRVAELPWCVVLFDNVHACHPQVQDVVKQMLADGAVTDGRGNRISLSNAVILLSADVTVQAARPIGFPPPRPAAARPHAAAEQVFDALFLEQVDLVVTDVPASDASARRWLDQILPALAEKYHDRGVQLHWDPTVVDWFLAQPGAHENRSQWERVVDEQLSPLLVCHVPEVVGKGVRSLRVKCEGAGIQVEPYQLTEGGA